MKNLPIVIIKNKKQWRNMRRHKKWQGFPNNIGESFPLFALPNDDVGYVAIISLSAVINLAATAAEALNEHWIRMTKV